ncbi:MAG: glycoside hydrolase family 9 protein [Opitutae bacterium]|nr:glycoside hydrolase family 9 protein [Opitutae bacterium]
MFFTRAVLASLALALAASASTRANELALPRPGDHALRALTPTTLELEIVTLYGDAAILPGIVGENFTPHLPPAEAFAVTANGAPLAVKSVGFKRRVLYAALDTKDVRLGNRLYLELAQPLAASAHVEVSQHEGRAGPLGPPQGRATPNGRPGDPVPFSPAGKPAAPFVFLWPADWKFTATLDPQRESPAIHVSEVGYAPALPKEAAIGYYLGSAGELPIAARDFRVIDAATAREVFRGPLVRRIDKGFPATPPPYREVFVADFSPLKESGIYRVAVDGLGVSTPFRIHDGAAMAVARAYALGLYHQRCGTENALPFTRFVHAACHVAPAEVPASAAQFPFTWKLIGELAAEQRSEASRPPHPFANDEKSQLYPFVRRGPLDVSGGHHDAGDYSKYTTNSAALVHTLVFAADALPGLAALDNLGLPESGDGIPDFLQEAKWEADYLAKLQDDDGGFYFLVYPRDRRYESNALPDAGEPQVVWPKNTAATAAAVAALAECAASPAMKKHYPHDAARYLAQAKRGWKFLTDALARHGDAGAYQRLTHYGDNFSHHDELAWAECELFLATGEPDFQRELFRWLPDPTSERTRRWGWWRLSESFGNAVRSYAFAARSGRLPPDKLDARYLRLCEGEILAAADVALANTNASAYGTAFPVEAKHYRNAGWYFSLDSAMDLAVGAQLAAEQVGFADAGACWQAIDKMSAPGDERADADILGARGRAPSAAIGDEHLGGPASRRAARTGAREGRLLQDVQSYVAALVRNLDFECGVNPLNRCFITGLGRLRQREIVSQYAHNDRRALPPSGLPLGNIQAGLPYHGPTQTPLRMLSFPDDGDARDPFAYMDRWSDTHNVSTEFVVTNQARGLVSAAFLASLTPTASQPWLAAEARIVLSKEKPQIGDALTARLEIREPKTVGAALRRDPKPSRSRREEAARENAATHTEPSLLTSAATNLADADIIWETRDSDPTRAHEFTFTPRRGGVHWIEAEVAWPDGRRVFAATDMRVATSSTAWVDDALPNGAVEQPGSEPWNWIERGETSVGSALGRASPDSARASALAHTVMTAPGSSAFFPPAPFSGTKAHFSASGAGVHEHGFADAREPLDVQSGDVLFVHVWLDPANPPRELMVSWNDGTSWEHRAYWGANVITYGTAGSDGRRAIGELPAVGKWARVEVPARVVGLEGRSVRGMSFASVDGRAVWDVAGARGADAKQ